VSSKSPKGEAVIRFRQMGIIRLNCHAVIRLGLFVSFTGVSFYQDPQCPAEIFICGDGDGWPVRKCSGGGAQFNNCELARHVIDLTWERRVCAAGDNAVKPKSYSFRIARLPVDDGKNKNVFALIRKKE
jgi:hypothetical protein